MKTKEEFEDARWKREKRSEEHWEICPDCGGLGKYGGIFDGEFEYCKLCEGSGIVYPHGEA